ncbi:hypothetical protein [Streptacidiphilus sp. PAMC 29251]
MTENAALEAATTEYVAANKAWMTHVNAATAVPYVEPIGLSDAEELLKRERTARENYAKELTAAGHAVPAGLLAY